MSETMEPRRASVRLRWVLAAALIGFVGLYLFTLGTGVGRAADGAAMPFGLRGPAWGRAHEALSVAVHMINIASLTAVSVIALACATTTGGVRRGARVLVCLAGANLTTHLLKPLLGSLNPLGGDALRMLHHSFPSGHATVAMSSAYALLAVLPDRWRGGCALLGSAYAAAVGIGMVMLHAHYPSDVLGGYLVATAWAAAAGLLTGQLTPARRTFWTPTWPSERRRAHALGGLGIASASVAAVWVALNWSNLIRDARAHAMFLGTAGAIMLVAIALPAVVGSLLLGASSRAAPAA